MLNKVSQPLLINGRPVGRWRASWLLFKESWRYLLSDAELLLVPIVTTIMMVILFAVLLIVVLATGMVKVSNVSTDSIMSVQVFIFVAGSYFISAFGIAFAQAMVTNTVVVRSHGENPTFGQSFKVAFRHLLGLVLWSLISATVGLVLRVISEKSERLGRIVSAIFGAAWGIMTYFVVPAMIIDNKKPFAAISYSASVFKKTWGESLIINISIGLVFLGLHLIAVLAFLGVLFLSIETKAPELFMVALIVWIVWLFAAVIVQQILDAIIRTLLYVYATATVPPQNFNAELLGAILLRINPPLVTTENNSINVGAQ